MWRFFTHSDMDNLLKFLLLVFIVGVPAAAACVVAHEVRLAFCVSEGRDVVGGNCVGRVP